MHASLAAYAARDFDHNPIEHANRLEKELEQVYIELAVAHREIAKLVGELDGYRDRIEALSLDLGIYDTLA